MTARCGYVTVEAEAGPVRTAFVLLEETAAGMIGAAPQGFLPDPIFEVDVPLGLGEVGESFGRVAVGMIPTEDLIVFAMALEEGQEATLFTPRQVDRLKKR